MCLEGNIYTVQLAAGSQTDRLWLVDAAADKSTEDASGKLEEEATTPESQSRDLPNFYPNPNKNNADDVESVCLLSCQYRQRPVQTMHFDPCSDLPRLECHVEKTTVSLR